MTQAYNLSQLANNLNSTGQLDATDGLVNAVPVANGGTGASTDAAARTNLDVPSRSGSGASGSWGISITGSAGSLASTLGVAGGGTGATTLASNNVLLGNGTSALQTIAPGTSGNVLRSNGTTWQSSSIPAGGFPAYDTAGRVTVTYNTLWQAPANGYVTISAVGSFINGLQVEVGNTSGLGTTILIMGNDQNNFSYAQSASFAIKSGSYAKIGPSPLFPYEYETVTIYFWPVS